MILQMRNFIYIFVVFIACFFSCDKAFENGDLDGMWRLENVEKEGDTYPLDGVYYSFQRHLVLLGKYNEQGAPELYMAEFEHSGGEIVMTGFYLYPGVDGVCNKEDLKKYCIYNDPERFVVDVLNNDVLVMHTNDGRIYSFRKW